MPSKEFGTFSESDIDDESLQGRIGLIKESLERETWLPISMRSAIAADLPNLKNLSRKARRFGRAKLAAQVFALALATWQLGPSPLESETLMQIRTLDLELNGSPIIEEGMADVSRSGDESPD